LNKKRDKIIYFNPRNEIDIWRSHISAELCNIIEMYLPSELLYQEEQKVIKFCCNIRHCIRSMSKV